MTSRGGVSQLRNPSDSRRFRQGPVHHSASVVAPSYCGRVAIVTAGLRLLAGSLVTQETQTRRKTGAGTSTILTTTNVRQYVERLDRGDLINIEYEAGVMHAACVDDP